jgi:hypothetical protein
MMIRLMVSGGFLMFLKEREGESLYTPKNW